MRDFRLLRPDEIECRVSEISKSGNGLFLLLYKTARTDAALLDETYGAANWQNEYRVLDGKMYCGIGVKFGDEWVWKWNVGTESNTEAEKGEASDAMKRAGFVLGIGTELYSSPRIWIPADECSIKDVNGRWRCYDSFSVREVEYDEKENISRLIIANDKTGRTCFRYGSESNAKPTERRENQPLRQSSEQKTSDILFRCVKCGNPLAPYIGADGKEVSVRKHAEGSRNKFGDVYCIGCIRDMQNGGNRNA